MNDERMPINLYTIDVGENDRELSDKEILIEKKKDCKPWQFLIGVCIAIGLIFIFMNIKEPEIVSMWIWGIIYLFILVLIVVSVFKIKKIMK